MAGLRVEFLINAPDQCPLADLTESATAPAKDINWSQHDTEVADQFTIEGSNPEFPDSVQPIFECDRGGVYEFERESIDCPCEWIEEAGHPLSDVQSEDGVLFLTLYLSDEGDVSELLRGLKRQYSDVSIRSITRTDADRSGSMDGIDIVPVNKSQLTERQQEVLETAYGMGYFDYPHGANAGEVADALGIASSTFAEHMAAAQSKVLADFLGEF